MAGDWVPGIAPPDTHPVPIPRVHLLPPCTAVMQQQAPGHAKQRVVGLRSVAQLTSEAYFSDIRTITEVYNLCVAGNR